MATRSMPMLSCRFSCCASLSLVPTPSVPLTSTGSRYLPARSNRAPKPPRPPITSGRKVRVTRGVMRSATSFPASMSTPASRSGGGLGWVTAAFRRQAGRPRILAAPPPPPGSGWTGRAPLRHHARSSVSRTDMRPTVSLFPLVASLLLALGPALPAAAQFEPAEPGPPVEPALPDDGEAGSAGSVRDPALYRGEVELLSQGAGEVRAATARALAQVVVKLSGDPQAAGNPVVRRALAQADSFVIASGAADSSDQQGNTAIGGVPVYRSRMSFDFDPGRVDALLAGAGLPYWGPDRPQPLLWLAIDDGRGPRLVSAQ